MVFDRQLAAAADLSTAAVTFLLPRNPVSPFHEFFLDACFARSPFRKPVWFSSRHPFKDPLPAPGKALLAACFLSAADFVSILPAGFR